jgi:hypothetical protein
MGRRDRFGGEATSAKTHCLPVSMRDAVRNFLKLLQEGKVWETEADAELGEKATSVRSTGKANSGPAGEAGEAAGAEELESGPAGKAAGADIEWHNEEGGNIADWLPEMYQEWALIASQTTLNTTIRLSWSRARIHHSARYILSRRRNCNPSEEYRRKKPAAAVRMGYGL